MLEPTITERANHQQGAILSMFRLKEGGWVNAQAVTVVTVRASHSIRYWRKRRNRLACFVTEFFTTSPLLRVDKSGERGDDRGVYETGNLLQ